MIKRKYILAIGGVIPESIGSLAFSKRSASIYNGKLSNEM